MKFIYKKEIWKGGLLFIEGKMLHIIFMNVEENMSNKESRPKEPNLRKKRIKQWATCVRVKFGYQSMFEIVLTRICQNVMDS